MKKLAINLIAAQLWKQVNRLLDNNDVKVVVVAGSIGKTSTKFAVARVLSEKYKVQFQEGNYNHLLTVPLIFFGLKLPPLKNPLAWRKTLATMKKMNKKSYPYDVVVLELGTDGPGQIAEFNEYLSANIGVVTAITPEHMEYFKTIQAVATEELSIKEFCSEIVLNADLGGSDYADLLDVPVKLFGKTADDYRIEKPQFNGEFALWSIIHNDKKWLSLKMPAVSMAEVYSATSASIVASKLGLTDEQIKSGVAKLSPVSGRMQRLKGIKNSFILDETYNASPEAVFAALDSVYVLKAPQKIAILGNMNELGDTSAQAHTAAGEYCDKNQLDIVITIGPDANKYLAPAAKAKGCNVYTFDNPYDAGVFVKNHIKPDAVILVKGSQNGVYAEEAIKEFLADPKDASKLVRQSKDWLVKKQKGFDRG